jgi:hypothetical protein
LLNRDTLLAGPGHFACILVGMIRRAAVAALTVAAFASAAADPVEALVDLARATPAEIFADIVFHLLETNRIPQKYKYAGSRATPTGNPKGRPQIPRQEVRQLNVHRRVSPAVARAAE